MSRLEKERDVLARHLQLSTQALEEFKELHEAETSALSEAHEELQAENADLRAALQQRDQDFQALSVAFDRMLTWREAQLDQQDVQGGGPQTSTMPQVAAEYSDSEDIDIEYEQPREYSHKRLLHARSLAVELSRELERHRDQLSQLQEEKAAALFLLQAKKDQLEELQAEQATREAEPDTLNGLHTQMKQLREMSLHDLVAPPGAPTNSIPTNAYETFKKVLSDIDIQIQQTETSLKSLKAERRVLDPRQPILDDPDLDELRTQLEHRESQLEDVARSAREALEAQSAECEVLRSDRDHQFSKVTELQSLTEQLERTLEQERSKTSDLTNRLEVLVQELDSAAAAKMDIER